MQEDKYIWENFKNDIGDALSYIYNQNVDFLFYYGKKFTSDEELIQDMIQDLFCDLIKYRAQLGNNDNIRLYLMKSYRRKLLHGLNTKKRRFKLDNDSHADLENVFSVEEDLITNEEQFRKTRLIRAKLLELGSKQQEIIYYKFTLGYDYNEICDIMSISYDSARQLVSRSIQVLKQYVTDNKLFLMVIFRRLKKT